MKKVAFLIVLCLPLVLNAQAYRVKDISQETIDNCRNKQSFNADYNSYKKKAYLAERSLPKNYKKDGTVDYTLYLQKVLDDNNVVLLPNFPIKINDKGLGLKNNQVLLFQPNSKLILKSTDRQGYNLLRVHQVSNVKIYYANLVGDKYRHLGKEGQWGLGIGIKSSSNVYIYSPYIKQTWGDGIYIGQVKNKPSNNVYIYNAVIDDVRRNGISITSAKKIDIVNSYISNTNGNSPQSGIDIEPNTINDEIQDILIKNVITENNKWSGILIVLDKLKGNKAKNISINIENHIDYNSNVGMAIQGFKNDNKHDNLSGYLSVLKSKYNSNKRTDIYFYRSNLSLLNIDTDNKDLNREFKKYKLSN